MENNKLGKKIRDWAISLGFRLPDGSTPSVNYFALLTATPHRRQLWEAVLESVQTRQKVQHMRKQILVARLQDEKKFVRNDSKQVTDRVEMWRKQNELENRIKEKRNAFNKLEKHTMAKISDLLFEICFLAELEKQSEELEEKILALKLFSNKEKKIAEVLENFLKKSRVLNVKDNVRKLGKTEDPECFMDELLNVEECKCPFGDLLSCKLLRKFEEKCKCGFTEEFLWEEVIKYKKNWLKKFSVFLEELIFSEKSIFCKKDAEIEKNVSLSILKLKQEMTEKSLQVMMNSAEGKLLDSEIKKLEKKVFEGSAEDETLNDTVYLLHETNECSVENENTLKKLKNHLNMIKLKSYEEFLKEKLKQLKEDEETERKDEGKEFENGEEIIKLTVKAFESIVDEINSLTFKEKEVEKQIIRHHDKLQLLLQSIEMESKSESKAVEVAVQKLKLASEKQIQIFSETPLEAFKTIESCSGKVLFECESAPHCFKNYGGEFKQFFSAMLIPPHNDLQKIFSEIFKRKQILNKVEQFISEREGLATRQRKIHDELNCISYDSVFCEKNFKESDGLLWSVYFKIDELFKETDFIEKILKNWVEQPYRLMLKEMPEGRSLKEYEEQFRKGKTDNLFLKNS